MNFGTIVGFIFTCAVLYVAVRIVIAIIKFIIVIVESIIGTIQDKREQKRQRAENAMRKKKEEEKERNLVDAVNKGDKETVRKLIEKSNDANSIDWDNEDEYKYILQIAVENNDKEMVSLLIDKGADVNLGWKKTPLDCAKDEEIISILKSHGAKTQSEVDLDLRKAEEKQRAARELQDILNNDLFASIKYHDKEKAESLISQGANVNVSDLRSLGFTPLLMAITNDDIEMVKLLLRHGADARQQVHIIGGGGRATDALQYARGLGKEDMADLLQYS